VAQDPPDDAAATRDDGDLAGGLLGHNASYGVLISETAVLIHGVRFFAHNSNEQLMRPAYKHHVDTSHVEVILDSAVSTLLAVVVGV
jgi:hypothetical protein